MKALFSSLFLLSLLFGGPLALAKDSTPIQVQFETSMGNFVLELYPDKAPNTVANFLRYVDEGFYNGTVFHRVIDGFMIQGGGFDAQFEQKPTHAAIENEADNGLRNTTGSIAMARTSAPHSATAQFFINVNDNSPLDFSSRSTRGWGYAVFGRIVSGMDVVNTIKAVPTGERGMPTNDPLAVIHQNVPLETITIQQANRLNTNKEDAS